MPNSQFSWRLVQYRQGHWPSHFTFFCLHISQAWLVREVPSEGEVPVRRRRLSVRGLSVVPVADLSDVCGGSQSIIERRGWNNNGASKDSRLKRYAIDWIGFTMYGCVRSK
jgi:hypothetical protein